LQDSNREESDYRLPVWKTASVSNNQPRYIRSPFLGKFSRFHRQIISFDETCESVNSTAEEIEQPSVFNNQVDQIERVLESSSEVGAAYVSAENELESSITGELGQPPTHDKQLKLEVGLEVESEMDSGYEATVIFEPCGNEPVLEVRMDVDIDIQNRIQALEERIFRLENEINRLEEINQKSKRGVIPLDGSMVFSQCGCTACSVE